MLEIIPFREEFVDAATALVTSRYRALRNELPLAPPRYAEDETIRPLLAQLTANAPAVMALRDGKLVGFLAAWMVPSWRGKPLAYSPEWANAADPADARRIYQALYTQIAPFWLRQRDLCPQCHRLRQRSCRHRRLAMAGLWLLRHRRAALARSSAPRRGHRDPPRGCGRSRRCARSGGSAVGASKIVARLPQQGR
ncbi:MAG: hypothetical protein R2856_33510 [Caldilineaceae bacterium]